MVYGEKETIQREALLARKTRIVAFVIAGTMLIWMAAQGLGGHFNWPARFVFLFDFAALAAFVWSLVVIWQIRRERRG